MQLSNPVDQSSTIKKITASAASLFRSKGFAATTTRELSDSVGIQKSSLYHYFDSKESLLFDLCMSSLSDVNLLFNEIIITDATSFEKLQSVFHSYVILILKDRDRHATMLLEIRSLSDQHRKILIETRDKNVNLIHNLVQSAQIDGHLRSDISTKNLVLGLFNLINWSIFWYIENGTMSAEEISTFLSKIFFQGVLPIPINDKAPIAFQER